MNTKKWENIFGIQYQTLKEYITYLYDFINKSREDENPEEAIQRYYNNTINKNSFARAINYIAGRKILNQNINKYGLKPKVDIVMFANIMAYIYYHDMNVFHITLALLSDKVYNIGIDESFNKFETLSELKNDLERVVIPILNTYYPNLTINWNFKLKNSMSYRTYKSKLLKLLKEYGINMKRGKFGVCLLRNLAGLYCKKRKHLKEEMQ